jgi:hypothetical protein
VVAALDRVRLPLKTVVTSAPTLLANVVTSPSGIFGVDESVMVTPTKVVGPNAGVTPPFLRKRISVIVPLPT